MHTVNEHNMIIWWVSNASIIVVISCLLLFAVSKHQRERERKIINFPLANIDSTIVFLNQHVPVYKRVCDRSQ